MIFPSCGLWKFVIFLVNCNEESSIILSEKKYHVDLEDTVPIIICCIRAVQSWLGSMLYITIYVAVNEYCYY